MVDRLSRRRRFTGRNAPAHEIAVKRRPRRLRISYHQERLHPRALNHHHLVHACGVVVPGHYPVLLGEKREPMAAIATLRRSLFPGRRSNRVFRQRPVIDRRSKLASQLIRMASRPRERCGNHRRPLLRRSAHTIGTNPNLRWELEVSQGLARRWWWRYLPTLHR